MYVSAWILHSIDLIIMPTDNKQSILVRRINNFERNLIFDRNCHDIGIHTGSQFIFGDNDSGSPFPQMAWSTSTARGTNSPLNATQTDASTVAENPNDVTR
jgi:hypothetical protein